MKHELVHSKLDEIAHVCTRFDFSVHRSAHENRCAHLEGRDNSRRLVCDGSKPDRHREWGRARASPFASGKTMTSMPSDRIMMIEVTGKSTTAVIRQLRGLPELRSLHTTDGTWDLIARSAPTARL